MKQQKIYTKTEALKIIINAAKKYSLNLSEKNLLLLYKSNNSLNAYRITFNDYNFLHFTGVNTKMSAVDFFINALNQKLTINDFNMKSNKLSSMKYDVIIDAMDISKNARMVGDFGKQGIKIKADLGLGNIHYTLTIDKLNNFDCYPKGLNKGDIRDSTFPTSPIVAILSKNITEKYFDTITYKSKNINIDKLHFPKEIKELLTEKALYELKPSLAPQDKIIENLSFSEVLAPINKTELIQNKANNEIATTKENNKPSLSAQLKANKEKINEHNQQKQLNKDNLEH